MNENKNPLVCKICKERFRYIFNLDKHLKEVHKDENFKMKTNFQDEGKIGNTFVKRKRFKDRVC